MKIVDKRLEADICKYKDIAFGEVFQTRDGEICIRTNAMSDAVKLKNGAVVTISSSESVRRIQTELHIIGPTWVK